MLACTIVSASVPQAILVQNSGWMEPFYTDKQSELKNLVKALAATVAQEEVALAAFNQATPGNVSPDWRYRGTPATEQFSQALSSISLAHKSGNRLADTDFTEAILGAIKDGLKNQSGIVWVITNNRNSPNNSPETRERNKDFYDLLHKQAAIARVVAYPLQMPVKGEHYAANGLMVYGIAYGKPAGEALLALSNAPAMQKLFTLPPARLKPLDQAAVRFLPKGVLDAPKVKAALAADGKTILISLDADMQASTATLVGVLENTFYPYTIASAKLGAQLKLKESAPISADAGAQTLSALEPGARSGDMKIRIGIPPLRSAWSPEVLFASGFSLPGELTVALDQQELQISGAFSARMQELFPNDALPEVFLPPAQLHVSRTVIPMVIHVNYPVGPLYILVGAIVVVVVLLLFLFAALRRAVKYDVVVNGISRKIAVKAFASADVYDEREQRVATLKRSLGRPKVVAQHDASATVLVK